MKSSKSINLWVILSVLIILSIACSMGGTDQSAIEDSVAKTVAASSGQSEEVTPEPPTEVPPTEVPTPTITPEPTATPEPQVGDTKINPSDGMTMIYIPAGNFMMGYDKGDSRNKPPHSVYLDSYWIDQTEVTNEMYSLCVKAGKCSEPEFKRSVTREDYYGNSDYDSFPVVYVTWNEAKKYCEWAGKQLPTEAQWEKAARGEDGFTYPWGTTLDNTKANISALKNDTTAVGSYPGGASPYGAMDMAGNVFEWVLDWYDKSYYQYSGIDTNPTGPTAGEFKSVRGGYFKGGEVQKKKWEWGEYAGSWDGYDWYYIYLKGGKASDFEFNYQSIYRFSWLPDSKNGLIGFRCVSSGD